MRVIKYLSLFIFSCSVCYSNESFKNNLNNWSEFVLSEMSLEEKIGQLFIVPACRLRGEDHQADINEMVSKYFIGGVILKQGLPEGQIKIINRLQNLAKVPLICVQDAEWGLAMRLEKTIKFPKNLTLGAIKNKTLLFALGKEIGRECKRVGAHVNLAPVVDVNNNALNPIIHMRSFGEDPQEVSERAILVMKGMEAGGVLCCAKHFPGHGDTAVDSHIDLPVVPHALSRLNDVEFLPFRKAISEGVFSVMTGHLAVPALEDMHVPATLSRKIVTGLLKNEMGFSGLVITDALNMKALAKHFSEEEVALMAFLAGNDLLLYGDHIGPNVDKILRHEVPIAISALKNAVLEGKINIADINARVLKILQAKQSLGLHEDPLIQESDSLSDELNTQEAVALKKELYREALTLVENRQGLLPLKREDSFAYVLLGSSSPFLDCVKKFALPSIFSLAEKEQFFDKLDSFSAVIVSVEEASPKEKEYGISSEAKTFLHELYQRKAPVVFVLFGTPYCLSLFDPHPAILVGYENDPDALQAAADALFGLITPRGKLPVSASPLFPRGTGL